MCNHSKLMSVNCVIKCAVCGAEIRCPTEDELFQDEKKFTLPKPKVAGRRKKGESKE